MAKLILTKKHRTLGNVGTEISVPDEVVQLWLDSGKAKVPGEAKKKSKKKDSSK